MFNIRFLVNLMNRFEFGWMDVLFILYPIGISSNLTQLPSLLRISNVNNKIYGSIPTNTN